LIAAAASSSIGRTFSSKSDSDEDLRLAAISSDRDTTGSATAGERGGILNSIMRVGKQPSVNTRQIPPVVDALQAAVFAIDKA
jgi:hypothetical protein